MFCSKSRLVKARLLFNQYLQQTEKIPIPLRFYFKRCGLYFKTTTVIYKCLQPDINSFIVGSSLIKARGLHAEELNRENRLK